MLNSDQRFQLCLKEIDVVKENIGRYDQNGLTIKSWCLTSWTAVTAYGLQNKDSLIVLLGVAVVVGFGFLELIYRRYQRRFIQRSAEIEAILASGDLRKYKYSVDSTATKRDSSREIKFALSQSQFVTFYVLLLLFSVWIAAYLTLK